jgi:putative CocE/NonD family hydrolase
MTPRLLVSTVGFLVLAAGANPAAAQGLEYVKANYTKYEYRIAMRDGKKLFTAVYVPKDDSKRYPIMLMRTPYSVGPYGIDRYKSDLGPSPQFGKSGYIFAYQDVRGRWMSEGDFVNMRPHNPAKKDGDIDESSDTWDTIEFLVKHVANNNGRVGQWGISYPGFYTAAGMIDAHPALKASSPQAPVTDWFIGDDFHHNGALFLPHMFNFMAVFGRPRTGPIKKADYRFDHEMSDGYQFFRNLGPLSNANARYFKNDVAFWSEAMKHGTYDEFWKARNLRQHLKNIRPAVMTVGGWFDAENLFGALETFKKVEATSEGRPNILVMGPWRHGGWSRGDGATFGDVSFNSKTSAYFRDNIEFPFFEFQLKGVGELKHPKAWVFETGTNQWRKHDAWPPKTAKQRSIYLRAQGKLSWSKTEDSEADSYDEYVSDPAKPVPYIDKIAIGMVAEYMVADQRLASRRPDVLVYQTDVLDEDVTIAGPIKVDLHVSTTGTDSDWIVKLIDVYPDDYTETRFDPRAAAPSALHMNGYQQLVRGDVMRGKFRNSFEKPAPFEPGKPTTVSFAMNDSYHTFRPGHRIMVQVQSSWFPLVDRNPQTLVDIYQAKESDFQKATQRVYRSREMPSRLTVLTAP